MTNTTIETINTINTTVAIKAAVAANNLGIDLNKIVDGKLEIFGREIKPIGKFGQEYADLAGFAAAREFHALEDNIEGMEVVDPNKREVSFNRKLIAVLQLMELWNEALGTIHMSLASDDNKKFIIATEDVKYEGVWIHHAHHHIEFMVMKENGSFVDHWFWPALNAVRTDSSTLWKMIDYRKGLAAPMESPVEMNIFVGSVINDPTSEAFKAFKDSIWAGEGIKVAVLRADEARTKANIEDLKFGLPMMAVGDFVDVKEGWGDLCSPNSSDYREYISGSGTRYLVSWQGDVIARIKTSETRSKW